MYGLPFGLLWPVARGSAFYTETVNYSESLETLSDRFSIALISSPVQLDKLPNNLNWPKLKNSINAIFSAGAPLPEAAATRCAEKLRPVIEIYGSTETGAVAWREQTADPLWQCLPEISISADTENQTLQIQSPCLSSTKNAWFVSADKVILHADQRFELLGRVDRICKIGAKRISLNHIERQLKKHQWVADAKCLLLEQRKSRLGAVIALTPEGRAALIDQGKLAINRQLNQSIAAEVETVAIPRYWRYLTKLPVDSQGKSATPILSSLFYSEQQPRLPEILTASEKLDKRRVELALHIPHNLFYFGGHFPGNPVLPGVVQIEWAQHFGRQFFTGTAKFVRLEALKFHHIIQPEDPVTLQLEWDKTKSRLNFSFTNHSIKYSSGRIVFNTEISHE
jgi:acyl-coenzyme A synthetase/AMP-(fatty) acid ligase/3-hydroxymyristoyl/3-hydroxydecanoyl-(acyl carrier protein) dehydratase